MIFSDQQAVQPMCARKTADYFILVETLVNMMPVDKTNSNLSRLEIVLITPLSS